MKTPYKYSIFVLLLLGFTYCSNKKRQTNTENIIADSIIAENDNLFQQTLAMINEINLPFDFFCGIDNYTNITDYKSEFLEKIAPKGAAVGVVGKLPLHNGYEYIIYGLVGDIIYPYLYTYDKNGNCLDSLYLHISYCAGDYDDDLNEEIIMSNYTIINSDYSINMVDTTRCITYNSESEIINDTVLISKQRYVLDNRNLYVMRER